MIDISSNDMHNILRFFKHNKINVINLPIDVYYTI